ncbi:hypothetical protein ACF08W_31560 [Streptomyces sp. NPDC015144]|uniref:hypothetical protein n=1 Tax=Streptomyces sp. NPDC015144 TaxID=3364944 RepID=UPI0036FCF128
MTSALILALAGILSLGLLTSLLLRKHRAALAFLWAVGEAVLLGAAFAFGTGPLLGGLNILMGSVVAVVLP